MGGQLTEMVLINQACVKIPIFLLPAQKKFTLKVLCSRGRFFFLYTCSLISSGAIVCLQEEIQQLKAKLEKVEKERNELRLNTDRLESKVRKNNQRNCTLH